TNAPKNANGLYWIDCKVNGVNQDLYIERSRILGTLLILNPGPNSRIDYGPINWSPVIPGYPALLVNGSFAIRATNHPLSETENGVDYNFDGITGNYNNVASEIHGLVGVSGVLTYKQNPQIRGRVIVGGNGGVPVNNGSPTVTYVPDSLINPPPPLGGFYTYRYQRRPASAEKVVLH
ncbi:MAG TPA: hypothetical protein VHU84_06255, partial [Lacipirellulaceae bacterium]|nr:hypothetical protein [Lacipirellulaceae bacterium]